MTADHAARRRQASLRDYQLHREARIAVATRWQSAHPDQHREAVRRWRAKQPRQPRVPGKWHIVQHRIESVRDLAAYLRKRGNLHMHYRRCGESHGWHLIHESRSVLCATDRCVMIPLTIS